MPSSFRLLTPSSHIMRRDMVKNDLISIIVMFCGSPTKRNLSATPGIFVLHAKNPTRIAISIPPRLNSFPSGGINGHQCAMVCPRGTPHSHIGVHADAGFEQRDELSCGSGE